MDALYKIFDRFSEMIPPQLLPVIRLGAILVWILFAVVVAILAWQQGSESAPQMGQELSLAEIKARQQREANLKKPQNVRVPDLNELIPERAQEPIRYESPAPATGERRENSMLDTDTGLIEPRNPANGPRYQGEGLAPRDAGVNTPDILPIGPRDYRPEQDSGVGGVREERGADGRFARDKSTRVQPLEPGVGLDGKPLDSEKPKRTSSETNAVPAANSREATKPAPVSSGTNATKTNGSSSGHLPLLD